MKTRFGASLDSGVQTELWPTSGSSLDGIRNKSALGFHGHTCYRPFLTIVCRHCGCVHRVLSGSPDRTCSACQYPLYERLLDHYSGVLNQIRGRISFLTLTSRPIREQSADHVRLLGKQVNQLFHRRPYCRVWHGVLAVVECKKTIDGLFYYHVHCVLVGGYVPQSQISRDWRSISGHSIVNISEIKRMRSKTVLKYALKYILKGFAFSDERDIETFRATMKGVRYVRSYGEFYDSRYHSATHVAFRCPDCQSTYCWIVDWYAKRSFFGVHGELGFGNG